MNEYALTLDLAKAKQRQQQTIFVRQGDKNATTIVATITDHGVAASTSGMTARFSMRLPNGTEYYRKAASLSGNTATVTIDEAQAASAVGRTDVAYFQLLQGSTVVASTESFTVVVLPDALADATVPESYDSAIQDAIDALDAAVEQMPDMVEDVLADHPEWTTTVQDGSITKAKLATDLTRDRERLMYRLTNMLTNALPEGETATATDAAQTPVAGLALYGRSTQDGTPTPSSPVGIVSVAGANLLPNAASTQTVNGLTFTVNADGSVTVTGTAAERTDFVLASGVTFDSGTYIIAGAPRATSTGDWNLRLDMTESPHTNYIFDNGYTSGNRQVGQLDANVPLDATIRVYAGKSPNATFYPMLNAGSTATYPYVPYGNVGLWARGRNLVGDLAAIKARNTAGTWSGGTYTLNGVSFAFGEDGSITANGTSTGLSIIQLAQSSLLLPAGTYTLSGCPAGGGTTTYRLDVERVGASVFATDNGDGATFTLDTDTNINVRLRVPSGANVSGKVFWPMLRLASTGAEFVPYTATVTPVPLDGHELRSLPDGTRDEVTVDERGHAVLVQRVGHVVLDGSSVAATERRVPTSPATATRMIVPLPSDAAAITAALRSQFRSDAFTYSADAYGTANKQVAGIAALYQYSSVPSLLACIEGTLTVAQVNEWLAANEPTLLYPLAAPVTHDLGYVDAVPLCGPDLTAQAIPTAPMQLTYERDLNATLARLESAIATLA